MTSTPPQTAPLWSGPILRDANAEQVVALLERWAESGWLRALDLAFARFLVGEVPDASGLLILAAALASHQLGRGHACLDLEATLSDPDLALSLPPEGQDVFETGEPPPRPSHVLKGLQLQDWRAAIAHVALVGAGEGATPLVQAGARLYLRRYWAYEQAVRAGIEQRLARSEQLQARLPREAMRTLLERLFPSAASPSGPRGTDWQKLACALCAGSAFSIITGGPGTGKTTTVVRLLALLQALAMTGALGGGAQVRALRIRLAAPTGKAAARLNESIAGAVEALPLAGLEVPEDDLRNAIPRTVSTVHRLLGSRPDTRRLRHDATNPLALDLLVIDEASMVDLEMMAAVLDALPVTARLILLGDKDQLASVEAGAVLGELCSRAHAGHYHPATVNWLQRVTGEEIDSGLGDSAGTRLDQAIVMLRHSHRFSARSGIGRLAEAVNAGDCDAVHRLWLESPLPPDLASLRLDGPDDCAFESLVIDGGLAADLLADHEQNDLGGSKPAGYRRYLSHLAQHHPRADADADAYDNWARAVLKAHRQFQVLCALRRGPWGVEGLNQRIAQWLQAEGLIPADAGWYLGRPVLVTRNDYGLGLMNGDIGVTLRFPDDGGGEPALRVAFAAGDGQNGIKWVHPSRLQAVETVYALTVHKSQGSEFDHAVLVLPDSLSPVLTRELLYTGITRARQRLTLVRTDTEQVLDEAVRRRVLRASGLVAP